MFFSNYYDILKKDESLQRDIAPIKMKLINHSICFDNSYCTSTHVVFNLDACPPYWEERG